MLFYISFIYIYIYDQTYGWCRDSITNTYLLQMIQLISTFKVKLQRNKDINLPRILFYDP